MRSPGRGQCRPAAPSACAALPEPKVRTDAANRIRDLRPPRPGANHRFYADAEPSASTTAGRMGPKTQPGADRLAARFRQRLAQRTRSGRARQRLACMAPIPRSSRAARRGAVHAVPAAAAVRPVMPESRTCSEAPRLYMEHLIVALHSHAFLCLDLLLVFGVMALDRVVAPDASRARVEPGRSRVVPAWMAVYLLIMRRVYRQGWPMTLLFSTARSAPAIACCSASASPLPPVQPGVDVNAPAGQVYGDAHLGSGGDRRRLPRLAAQASPNPRLPGSSAPGSPGPGPRQPEVLSSACACSTGWPDTSRPGRVSARPPRRLRAGGRSPLRQPFPGKAGGAAISRSPTREIRPLPGPAKVRNRWVPRSRLCTVVIARSFAPRHRLAVAPVFHAMFHAYLIDSRKGMAQIGGFSAIRAFSVSSRALTTGRERAAWVIHSCVDKGEIPSRTATCVFVARGEERRLKRTCRPDAPWIAR